MDDRTCRAAGDHDPCAGVMTKHDLCTGHFQRWRRTGYATRHELILSRLLTGASGECWPWGGNLNRDGYGILHIRGVSASLAHRLAYEMLVGPITEEMTVDHMCHRAEKCAGGRTCSHRRCCNPAHLKLAGRGPNALRGNSPAGTNSRKEYCDSGHEYDEANTYWYKGKRQCRACRRVNDRKRESGSVRQRRARQLSAAG